MIQAAALAQSLLVKAQCTALARLGSELRTPVLFLKAAWADPVLYGGRGERRGADIDILVSPTAFGTFAAKLAGAGYHRQIFPSHLATNDAAKEWLFLPDGGGLPVDLHRGVANWPWFDLPTEPLLRAAKSYHSPDGPILSLAPDDQVLFAAAHYANHALRLDNRHLEDLRRLLSRERVDWNSIQRRAIRAGLALPLKWVARRLDLPGDSTPASLCRLNPAEQARLAGVERLMREPDADGLWLWNKGRILAFALLSNRQSALGRFLLWYTKTRLADYGRRT